jgi:hypothetical protein
MDPKTSLDQLTKKFFNLFTNTGNKVPDLRQINDLFLPEGIIIKNVGGKTEIFSLASFIGPRQKMLTDGTLTAFKEEELSEKTEIYGNIGHRFSAYKKSGSVSGKPFETQGMKTIQFVKTGEEWRISAVAWDDES